MTARLFIAACAICCAAVSAVLLLQGDPVQAGMAALMAIANALAALAVGDAE